MIKSALAAILLLFGVALKAQFTQMDPGLDSGIYLLKLVSGEYSTTLRLGLVK